jgi:hypothetical protein
LLQKAASNPLAPSDPRGRIDRLFGPSSYESTDGEQQTVALPALGFREVSVAATPAKLARTVRLEHHCFSRRGSLPSASVLRSETRCCRPRVPGDLWYSLPSKSRGAEAVGGPSREAERSSRCAARNIGRIEV